MTPPPRLVDIASADGLTRIIWSDGFADTVSPTWLRHACHCQACRGPDGGQRRFDLATVPADLAVSAAHLGAGGIDVTFTDGHAGVVPASTVAGRRPPAGRPFWDAGHRNRLRAEAIVHRGDLGGFLAALDRDGVALVDGLPAERGEVVRFATRIGFVRETNYGRSFDVVAEPDPANLANSTDALPLHTDNPYRDPVPTLQLLHCIETGGSGGATRLVDGWGAAERLRAADPAAFALLATREVPFRFVDHGVDLRARGRLIELDAGGEVVAVRMNNRSMEPLDLPAPELEPFYAAYRAFAATLADPAAVVELTLRPGDLVAFDNRRVLHGRTGYRADTRRLLQGCYVDIDAVRSAVRVQEAASA